MISFSIGKFLPTTLNTTHNTKLSSSKLKQSISNLLEKQYLTRQSYGNRRGNNKLFCSWNCAIEWNWKNTPTLYRYETEKLIKIAASNDEVEE